MKNLTTLLAVGLLAFAGAAAADDYKGKHGKRHYRAGPDGVDYGKVVDVRPLYREVEVSRPVRECWREPVYRDERRHDDGRRRHVSAGDMLAGGIIGGIIGHQIGHGEHRRFATAVGTLIGAQIGSRAGGHDDGHRAPVLAGHRQACSTTHEVSTERVVDAYSVTYRYHGRTYETEMPYDPGKRIKLRVRVEPVL